MILQFDGRRSFKVDQQKRSSQPYQNYVISLIPLMVNKKWLLKKSFLVEMWWISQKLKYFKNCELYELTCLIHILLIRRKNKKKICVKFGVLQISAALQRCSKKMQQVYRRTSMPKRDFNKVALLKSRVGMAVLL